MGVLLLEETENKRGVKGNKKMVQQYILEKSGKFVTLKDLQNISDKIKDKSVVVTVVAGYHMQ